MFAGSMCCKVGMVLARGATPAPVPRVNPVLPIARWTCSAAQTQEEGAKVLTSLRLETQPKFDTEYPLCHFMFPFAKHQPPFRSYPSFPFALLTKLLRLIFLGLVDEFSKFYYV